MNSNIIQMQRSGMLNDKSYGLIDNLGISYEGNQRVKITDAVRDNLDYANAFDFRDGVDSENEYAYNANGALIKDLNKDITKIEYDLLGNPLKVKMSDNRSIEYVYSADGRRLRTTHKKLMTKQYVGLARSIPYMRYESETFDYYGNLILKNNKPQMYRFSGGYYDFRDDGSLSDAHYYIADYQGNNRMVVNASTDAVEQVNHYYAYGGIIGNLSSNEGLQEFKFGDKKLDRTYGLDLYDFEARQYDAIAPWFTSIDPLAEKYYGISPYAYCGGDPINRIDPTGMEWGTRQNEDGTTTIYVDVQLIVDGDGITDEMIEAYKQAICSEFNRMISEASGGTYLGEVTFNGNVVEGQLTPSLTICNNGANTLGGTTQGSASVVEVLDASGNVKAPSLFASDAIHEILHTVRFDHPFEFAQTKDTQLINDNGNYLTTPETDPNIIYNVMLYNNVPINGRTYKSLDSSDPQTMMTKGQLNLLLREIKHQQNGRGLDGTNGEYYKKKPRIK